MPYRTQRTPNHRASGIRNPTTLARSPISGGGRRRVRNQASLPAASPFLAAAFTTVTTFGPVVSIPSPVPRDRRDTTLTLSWTMAAMARAHEHDSRGPESPLPMPPFKATPPPRRSARDAAHMWPVASWQLCRNFVLSQLALRPSGARTHPLIVGVQGPQGSGTYSLYQPEKMPTTMR